MKDQRSKAPDGKIANPAKVRAACVLPRYQRYSQVNQRIKELLPSTLELCLLIHEVERDELYKYSEPPYGSLKEWAAKEHTLADSSTYQYRNAGRVCKLLNESTAVDLKPQNQAQLRPLLPLKNDQQVIEIWAKAVELASVEPSGGANITENTVAKAKRMTIARVAQTSSPEPEFDLEERWTRLASLLEHEREFWPSQHRSHLSKRIAALIQNWEAQTEQKNSDPAFDMSQPESDEPEPAQRRKIPHKFSGWQYVNWRLKNRDLAAIWHLDPLTVRQMRYRKRHGRAPKCAPAIYQKEIEEEKHKAQAFFKSIR